MILAAPLSATNCVAHLGAGVGALVRVAMGGLACANTGMLSAIETGEN